MERSPDFRMFKTIAGNGQDDRDSDSSNKSHGLDHSTIET